MFTSLVVAAIGMGCFVLLYVLLALAEKIYGIRELGNASEVQEVRETVRQLDADAEALQFKQGVQQTGGDQA